MLYLLFGLDLCVERCLLTQFDIIFTYILFFSFFLSGLSLGVTTHCRFVCGPIENGYRHHTTFEHQTLRQRMCQVSVDAVDIVFVLLNISSHCNFIQIYHFHRIKPYQDIWKDLRRCSQLWRKILVPDQCVFDLGVNEAIYSTLQEKRFGLFKIFV